MTSTTKGSDTPSFQVQQPFLSEPHLFTDTDRDLVAVLTPYPPPERHRLLTKTGRRCLLCFASSLVLLAAAGYLLWPYNPNISIVRVYLQRVHFHRLPKFSIDLELDLRVRILNGDFYSINYDSLIVAVGYRGKQLGFAISDRGSVSARGTSFVNATLRLDHVEIFSDVILMLEDLAKGSVTFDTQSEIDGKLGFFFIEVPFNANAQCDVIVNTRSQTISHQSCYPEVGEQFSGYKERLQIVV